MLKVFIRKDGLTINEAVGCECFPIATNIPANSQWIDQGENGFLFDIYDFKKLAECIIGS